MIATLDSFRDTLEDLGSGLGVTERCPARRWSTSSPDRDGICAEHRAAALDEEMARAGDLGRSKRHEGAELGRVGRCAVQ